MPDYTMAYTARRSSFKKRNKNNLVQGIAILVEY